ncbi:hypothetical protein JAAARDRAFT_206228 [Jaapia argillacea MUCL 33604]|uniref:Uncharacterized protein n=1 Tax=Jaapia argillacea MUCL 33604 TaxID=933084 RepID=A0A067Q9Q0_9AGAM|nr:hypothetical protein JAAARDRAFT_206228 [Jaapia argillacea MUCL 33604]
MSLLANIAGFSIFGLAARLGQLGIQKRPLLSNPTGHLVSMGVFGFAGYWAYQWDVRAAELIAEKRSQIQEHRRKQIEAAENSGVEALAGEH